MKKSSFSALLLSCLSLVVLLPGLVHADATTDETPQALKARIAALMDENLQLQTRVKNLQLQLDARPKPPVSSDPATAALQVKRDALKARGLDPDLPVSDDFLSEFQKNEGAATQKYSGGTPLVLQGNVTAFNYELGISGVALVLAQNDKYKVVLTYNNDQVKNLRPAIDFGFLNNTYECRKLPHYDGSQNAIVADVRIHEQTYKDYKLLGLGSPVSNSVRFDRVQEGTIYFIAQ